MPGEMTTTTPEVEERTGSRREERESVEKDDLYVVILYNDDYHEMMEVVAQIQKATGYPLEKCVQIMFEAHRRGRAIAYSGSATECERVAQILRQIRLQVETDRF